MNKCTNHKYVAVERLTSTVFCWILCRECEYCGARKVYTVDDEHKLYESKTIVVNDYHTIEESVPSKDRWCDWCPALLTKPFITIDDKEMCNECAKEYNQEMGW